MAVIKYKGTDGNVKKLNLFVPMDSELSDTSEDGVQNKVIKGAIDNVQSAVNAKSTVSVSASGTATDEVQYITIDGVEKKLAGGGASAGVSSLGGKTGAIPVSANFVFDDNNTLKLNSSIDSSVNTFNGQLQVSKWTGNGIVTGNENYEAFNGIQAMRYCNDSHTGTASLIIDGANNAKVLHRYGNLSTAEDANIALSALEFAVNVGGAKGTTTLNPLFVATYSATRPKFKGTDLALATDVTALTDRITQLEATIAQLQAKLTELEGK